MPNQIHDTSHPESLQLDPLSESWQREVVPNLPEQLEQQAKTLKALVRHREIGCACDLLRGVLAYVLCVSSFRHLGCWAVLIGLADLSEAAWRKRLRQASDWLLWLLGELLSVRGPGHPAGAEVGPPVLLIDATRLRQVGGSGDDWRVHLAYDLQAGRISQVTVTDKHTAESLGHTALSAGVIVVADNGYGYRRSVAQADREQAKVVLRITPNSFPLEDEQGQALDVVSWLRKQPGPIASLHCWCQYNGQRYRLRLIARRLSPAAARAARLRKKRKASMDKRRVLAETLFLADWVLLVTTLEESQWSEAQVLRLYRARWQIELVFKRIKQLLQLHLLRPKTAQMAQATIRALLVAWALQQEEACLVREQLAHLDQEEDVCNEAVSQPIASSSWLLSTLCVGTLRQQVQGHWDRTRLRHCLPRFRRFLLTRRRRGHQERDVRLWLARRLAAAHASETLGGAA